MIGKRGRDTHRPIHIGHQVFGRSGFCALDLALDLANGVEVLIDANAVGRPDFPFEPRDIVAERIEQAAPIAQCGATAAGAVALAEEAFEHDPRMGLGRKRRRR